MPEAKSDQPKAEPRVARGRALKWTTTAIADLSRVTEERLEAARDAWHRHSDGSFRTLIDAERDDVE